MRICYVSFEYPPQFGGGIGTYVGNISMNLASEGCEVHVITFNPGNLVDSEVLNDVHVHRIKMNEPQVEVINRAQPSTFSTLLYWSLYSEKVYRKLRELTLNYCFDVVEFADYRGEGYFSMLAKKTRGEFKNTSLIIRMHTPLFVLNKYNNTLNDNGMKQLVFFENFPIMMADYVVSPCLVLARLTNEELSLEKKVEILPHPIDLQSFPSHSNYIESEKILYVGRLERRKGVIDFIKALIEFLPRYPKATACLIGGDTDTAPEGGSMKDYLYSLLPEELHSRVRFIDRLPREDVLKEYQTSRFCVFPSLFENFPNVCLEAMASGIPVLVSHFSGMAEMVEHGESGMIFEAQNISDLVKKIERMYIMTFEQRAEMGKAARKRVEKCYSAEAINKQQIEYFIKISKKTLSIGTNQDDYEKGKVSVIIPCYNHGEFLEETIKSVHDNIYKNIEIIVVNDGSTNLETIEVLKRIENTGVKVIHQKNAGLSAARNTGISHAVGEYILPLDADDKIEPTFLEKTVKELDSNPNVGFVYTDVKYFGAHEGIWKTPEFDPNLLLISNLCVATSLFRHVAFDQIGGYKLDMIYGFEDWDFWIYMVENGWSGKRVREPLFLYRQHQESMLSNSQKHRAFLIQKLVEHHKDSYKQALEYVLVEKDRQFFEAHMSNYFNYNSIESIRNSFLYKAINFLKKIKKRLI